MQLEGKKLKIELKGGKNQENYFLKIKGSKTLNSGCTGKEFRFNGDTYHSSVLTARVNISISRETGRYNPDDGNLVIPGKIVLRPLEMSKTRKSGLVFDNDVNQGT